MNRESPSGTPSPGRAGSRFGAGRVSARAALPGQPPRLATCDRRFEHVPASHTDPYRAGSPRRRRSRPEQHPDRAQAVPVTRDHPYPREEHPRQAESPQSRARRRYRLRQRYPPVPATAPANDTRDTAADDAAGPREVRTRATGPGSVHTCSSLRPPQARAAMTEPALFSLENQHGSRPLDVVSWGAGVESSAYLTEIITNPTRHDVDPRESGRAVRRRRLGVHRHPHLGPYR